MSLRSWITWGAVLLVTACSRVEAQVPSGPADAAPVAPPKRGEPQWLLPVPELVADPKIPTLHAVLGYRWGEDVSDPAQIERYVQALVAAAPDRAKLQRYGTTYEGRPLSYLVIASAENLARLEELRVQNLALADPTRTPAAAAATIIEKAPAVVWLGYVVHGNESSGSDAALLTAYHLLADTRDETCKWLEQVIVIIDPLQNPDGRQRFIAAYREARGEFPQGDAAANEHTERWPGGRFNHYLFDMNRDWFLQTQTESRAKTAAMLRWRPHVTVDAHEMGADSSYYFAPPTDPINELILPRQRQWYERLGRRQAAEFDRHGFAYTAREMFDSFYPGYGESWPSLQGAIGVLWEQAGVRGLVVDREDETQLHYHDAVRHHYISGLATVALAAEERRQLLDDAYQVHVDAVRLGSEGPVRHFFLLAAPRADRTLRLVEMLERNGIDVGRLEQSLPVRCTSVNDGTTSEREIPAGSFQVALAQPSGRLARTLLERHAEMDREFVHRQLERQQRRLDDEFYDVTAWSLPLAFDVECLGTDAELAVAPPRREPDATESPIPPAQVAYLVSGTPDASLTALSQWLRAGLRVHVADQPLELSGKKYDRGSLILKVAENPDSLREVLSRTARDPSLELLAADSAFVSQGAQLGGPNVTWVKPPRVALVMDRPTSFTAGHTWYAFDQVWHYPTTRVAARNLSDLDWSRYDVLILPDGNYTAADAPDKELRARISSWVAEGGTLVLFAGATRWACDKDIGWLPTETRNQEPSTALGSKPTPSAVPPPGTPQEAKPETPAALTAIEETKEPEPLDSVAGAFFRAELYDDHWLTFGCPAPLNLFFSGDVVLKPLSARQGRNLVRFADRDDLLVSGFCFPATLTALRGQAYLAYRPLGKGHIVAFADDPNFRGFSPATQRLFANAVFFGPGH